MSYDGDFEKEDFDEESFEEQKRKALEALDKKYFFVTANNVVTFVKLLKETGNLLKAVYNGLEYSELENLSSIFSQNNVSAIFVPFSLMKEFSKGENLNKLYRFKPINGKEKGILVPEQVDITEGRPERNEVIDGSDIDQLSKMLNSDIDFDTFLKLT